MNSLFSIDRILLILNFLVTIFCGVYISHSLWSRKVERHPFYYFWLVGFILYALEILTRAFFVSTVIVGVLLISSYFIFVLGLWFLGRRKLFLIIYMIIFLATILLFSFWGALKLVSVEEGKIFASVTIYGGLTILILYHRTMFGRIADKFIFGWLLLCITNLFLPTEWFVTNIFAIFSKVILLAGVMDQEFAILVQKVDKEIMSTRLPPSFTGYGKEGKLKLIMSSNVARSHRIKLLEQTIQGNVRKGVDTYIFSFQDVIPHGELRRLKWADPKKIKVFLFSSSADRARTEFTVLPMGMTQIGAALSEVIKKYSDADDCTVFFTDLSLLIHLFGVYPVYNLLLSKMGGLREAGIELFAFFHPETHSDKSVVSLFTNISDEVRK